MLQKMNALLAEIEQLQAHTSEELDALRIKYLSKKGEISLLMNDFRTVASEQKREIGQKLNELKSLAQEKINTLKEQLENRNTPEKSIDLTRTSCPYPIGTRHPLSIIKKEIC
ncbi:MAG: phenylalanine--tRNA ligase subunit alpha, partial [Dysgonamonadaceae bacterium]|nr:phenylalanine--tRNA ligase subunit alpha [Dysgonamonadaceae bacterium]